MSKLSISLLAGAAALVGGAAQAAPLTVAVPDVPTGIEQVRMVCDQTGRCWNRPSRRVIMSDTFNNAYNSYEYDTQPRYGYSGYYDPGPSVSFGVGTPYSGYHPGYGPGFSFGVRTGPVNPY